MKRLGVFVLLAGLAGAPSAVQAAESTAVTVPLRAGATLESALAALNAQGYHIVYSNALVQPSMTLRDEPRATRIEDLLREILAPWKLRAVQASNGDWLIAADETPTATSGDLVDDHYESIDTIDYTASRVRHATAGATQTILDRADVQRMPHLADDAVRMLKVLPGVTGGDFSAALNIRGGRREEALLTIDGAEIHNAFHFRDLDGALSVLDTNLVQGIDFITGGMTAEYGDYMSGVIGLETRMPAPDDEYRSGVGISFVSAYGRTGGNYAGERGSWLVSLRRGFLDLLMERVMNDDEQMTPRYTDLFAATTFEFDERNSVSARLLVSDDDLRLVTTDDTDDVDSAGTGRSAHAWLGFDHAWSETLQMNTMLSYAMVNQQRDSIGEDEFRSGDVRADNEFSFLDLKQDWSWQLDNRQLVRWGFNAGRHEGDYDYALTGQIFDPLISIVPIDFDYGTMTHAKVDKFGVYGSWRSRLTDALTAEAGARWDSYRYSGGLEAEVFSPRVNAVYTFPDNSELRAAWGVMHQPQSVNELQVEDDIEQFFGPERSEQFVIGYTRHFPHEWSLRVDLYDKAYSDLRPRFENALDPMQLIPEAAPDRIRIDATDARARGVELTVRHEAERGLAGWVSVSIASAEDDVGGELQSRSWEQEETLSFGASWTGVKWNLSLAGLFHTGLPTTYIGIETEPLPGGGTDITGVVGPHNAERYGAYSRVDLRANRDVQLRDSKISFYLEVTNLLNSENECCIEGYRVEQGPGGYFLGIDRGYYLPMLPSFGFQWEF
jgi:outer membrane receptor protein involved in Fe transport